MFYYIAKYILWIYFHIAYSVKYEGKENIPKDTNAIYTANHRTNADPPLVGVGVPKKSSFMAKEELFKNKFFGFLLRNLGAFPVSRGKGDTAVIDTSVERLNKGDSLLIFPEGTRSKDGKVHKGHSGAAVVAARTGKPIIPVGVIFGDKLGFRTKITIKYGTPIDINEYVEVSDTPSTRQTVRLKKRYMADIKMLVEGTDGSESETDTTSENEENERS